MSSKLDPEAYRDRIGTTETFDIGTIARRTAKRYARAVEDDNPLFHDVEYAREQGYDDVVVPPNYLSAIIDHTEGPPTSALREDGLDPTAFPIELPAEAILMGGGQSLTIDRYVTAGESVRAESTLTDISQREGGTMGTLTFIEEDLEYFVGEERVLRCEATMIVGDRQ